MNRYEVKQKAFRNRQHKLSLKCKNGKCLILKGGYYYRDNHKGYTEFEVYAGVYDVHDALMHVTSCSYTDFLTIVPIDTNKHNKLIVDNIKLISGHLI